MAQSPKRKRRLANLRCNNCEHEFEDVARLMLGTPLATTAAVAAGAGRAERTA